jgi:predicted component of type VI protein secretion system
MSNVTQQQALQQGEAFSQDEFSALLNKEFRPKTEQARSAVESAVQTLAQQALANTVTFSSDTYRTIQNLIAGIDEKLSQQVNEIIHHEEFQKLESAWRGLSYLVNNTETDEMLKIRFMSISKPELGRVLKRYKGVGWDQSPIFKKSTKKSTVSSVANRLAAWWEITTSITARRMWNCWVKWHASARRRTVRLLPAPRRVSCRWNPGRNWRTHAT